MKTVQVAVYYSDSTNSYEASYLLEVSVNPADTLANQIATIHAAVGATITDVSFRGYKIVSEGIDWSFGALYEYKLNDASGNAIDSIGGINLTPTGTPTYHQPGILETAIAFTPGSYFSRATSSSLEVSSSGMYIISFWFNISTPINSLLFKSNGTGRTKLYIYTDDYGTGHPFPTAEFNNVTVSTINPVTINSWHHLALVLDINTPYIYLYIDNVPTIDNSVQLFKADAGDFYIADDSLGTGMTGLLDHLRAWHFSDILSNERRKQYVSELYNNGIGNV
jgi:hypothetical protein